MKNNIFSPVIALLVIQFLGMCFYQGFYFIPSGKTYYMISLSYILIIASLLLFPKIFKSNLDFSNKDHGSHLINVFIFLLVFLFITKPTIALILASNTFGPDYVRANFFSNSGFRSNIFGSVMIGYLTQNYIVPILWFMVFFLIGNKKKSSVYLFYYLLISLVVFNMAYAGRFYLYFAFIVLFIRNILIGQGNIKFLIKFLPLFLIMFFVSLFIVAMRRGEGEISTNFHEFLILVEYHLLPPFFLMQKIDHNVLLVEGYPFRVFGEGLLAPVLYLFGSLIQNLPQVYYPVIFDDPSLYSSYTYKYYNAFSTFIAYIYSDFGLFTPIICVFFIFSIFLFSLFINDISLRLKYLGYFSLMLYFSMFQSPIFSSGTLIVLYVFPLIYLLKSSVKKST